MKNDNPRFLNKNRTSEQMKNRFQKRIQLINKKLDIYPIKLKITHSIKEVINKYKNINIGEHTSNVISISGRLIHKRDTGKLCFGSIQDGSGLKIQIMLSLKEIGVYFFNIWKSYVDLGDIIYSQGKVIKSKKGELSILVSKWKFAAKSLRPLPVLYKDLSSEYKSNKRYIELIVNQKARDMVNLRSNVLNCVRKFLFKKKFKEVETPILHKIYGGATANPFKTHVNVIKKDMFLRISPELYLKRMLVGGMDKIFEISKNFRNEGIDAKHLPEFLMLEAYEAYGDYNSVAYLTQKMIQTILINIFGSMKIELHNGLQYDMSGNWKTISLYKSLSEALEVEITPDTNISTLMKEVKRIDMHIDDKKYLSHGEIIENLWEFKVSPLLYKPTFVRDFPLDTSPLVKKNKNFAEKWDLYIRGMELATGYSELTDPVFQRSIFEKKIYNINNEYKNDVPSLENHSHQLIIDEDFLEAIEYGLPPTGGLGIGIDRLLVAFTGLSIKDTVLFPLTK